MRNKKSIYKTTFFFPRTNFAIGMGSIFNIVGNYYRFRYSKTPQEADRKAIENDWGVIGQDIKNVVTI